MSDLVAVNTADLVRDALNWAVAKIEGLDVDGVVAKKAAHKLAWQGEAGPLKEPELSAYLDKFWSNSYLDNGTKRGIPNYSADPALGVSIIDREKIGLIPQNGGYDAYLVKNNVEAHTMFGPTLLTASMRCLVAAELGLSVMVPRELVNIEPVVDAKKIGPVFSVGQKFDFKVGDQVVANGSRGAVINGSRADGMIDVQLPGREVCTLPSFPDCFPAVTNGVEVVTEGRFFGKVEEVGNQFVVQNAGRGRVVAHETHRFAVLPVVGQTVNLESKGGKVEFLVEVDKGQGTER